MYQTPSPTPSPRQRPRSRPRRSDRAGVALPFGLQPEAGLAAALTAAVAAGMLVAGGSGRPIEVAVLVAAAVIAVAVGWPVSGHTAAAAAAAYLILETLLGRLHGSHAGGLVLLTAGVIASVLAAGFVHREPRAAPQPRLATPTPAPALRVAAPPAEDPWAAELPGHRRLVAGTLEYEIERGRRSGRSVGLLRIRADDLDLVAASGEGGLARLHRPLSDAIEETVRAIDVVTRVGRGEFEVVLPETQAEGARTVAERIRLRVDSTGIDPETSRPTGLSVSIGAAVYPHDGTDAGALRAGAARALAQAAGLGGNRTLLFSLPEGAPRGWAMSSAEPPAARSL